jgi:hypothetical protein
MTRWLIPTAVAALLAVAFFAFPDEVGAGDEDEALAMRELDCLGFHDGAAAPDVYRTDAAAGNDAPVDARTEPQEPLQPNVTLVAEPAPGAGTSWTWFALAGLVGTIGVAGLAYSLRPALSRNS